MATKENHVINWEKVESYLHSNLEELPDEKMNVIKFSEGFSNLTYLIKIGEWEAVLRRAPAGYVPPKAHDMFREYTILQKVNPVFSLAPKPIIYCENLEIMDKPFYLMERKAGHVIDGKLPPLYENTIETKKSISQAVIETLVQLHSIDYVEAKMNSMGKPEGYVERQVNGWIKRYANAKTDQIIVVEEIEAWLKRKIPTMKETTIVHNDFKLNNMVFDSNYPNQITGVLDWELSTIGDPLTDLGATLVYWSEADDPYIGIKIITNEKGFLTRREMLDLYIKKSGREVSNIDFYVTFGFYKLAVIQQQLYYRWKIGEVKDDRLKELKESIQNLMFLAHETKQGRLL